MSAAAEYYGYLLSQGYGEHQINKFAEIAGKQDMGIISANQAYRQACGEGFNNMTEEQASAKCESLYETEGAEAYNRCYEDALKKKGFTDWLTTAKDAGWIDKGMDFISGMGKPRGGGETVIITTDKPKSNTGLYVAVGAIALIGVGAAIYFGTRKK